MLPFPTRHPHLVSVAGPLAGAIEWTQRRRPCYNGKLMEGSRGHSRPAGGGTHSVVSHLLSSLRHRIADIHMCNTL